MRRAVDCVVSTFLRMGSRYGRALNECPASFTCVESDPDLPLQISPTQTSCRQGKRRRRPVQRPNRGVGEILGPSLGRVYRRVHDLHVGDGKLKLRAGGARVARAMESPAGRIRGSLPSPAWFVWNGELLGWGKLPMTARPSVPLRATRMARERTSSDGRPSAAVSLCTPPGGTSGHLGVSRRGSWHHRAAGSCFIPP